MIILTIGLAMVVAGMIIASTPDGLDSRVITATFLMICGLVVAIASALTLLVEHLTVGWH
jgi:hypothetical protein